MKFHEMVIRKCRKVHRFFIKHFRFAGNILFGIIFTFIFFGCIEAVLMLFSQFDPDNSADPFAGYYYSYPFLIKNGDKIQTNIKRYPQMCFQEFTAKKPENTKRIFVFGGSNVVLFSQVSKWHPSLLEYASELLNSSSKTYKWEIINCGGNGWSSTHAAAISSECIAYDPDIFILYSGHNDFRWKSFAKTKKLSYMPGIIVSMSSWATQFRIYTLAKIIYRNFLKRFSLYENSERTLKKTDDSYIEQFYYNVSTMAKMCHNKNISFLPITVPSNLLMRPNRSKEPPKKDHLRWNEFRWKGDSLFLQFIPFIVNEYEDSFFSPYVMINFIGDPAEFYFAQYRHYKRLPDNEQELIKTYCRKVYTENSKKRFLQLYNHIYKTEQYSEAEKEIVRTAQTMYEKAEVLFSENAFLEYKIGLCDYILENYEQAYFHLEKSMSLDMFPTRSCKEMNNTLKSSCENNNIQFLDFREFLEKHSFAGISGWEYFNDDCHLNDEGRMMLIKQIVKHIEKSFCNDK